MAAVLRPVFLAACLALAVCPACPEARAQEAAAAPGVRTQNLLFVFYRITANGMLSGKVVNRTGMAWHNIRLSLVAMDNEQSRVFWSKEFSLDELEADTDYPIKIGYGKNTPRPGHVAVSIDAAPGPKPPPRPAPDPSRRWRLTIFWDAKGVPVLTNRTCNQPAGQDEP